jgi:hypothetical protein
MTPADSGSDLGTRGGKQARLSQATKFFDRRPRISPIQKIVDFLGRFDWQ